MSSRLQAKHRWTYTELVALRDDQMRHELIDGEHFVSPSPATTHQKISKRLFVALNAFVQRHRLGEALYAPLFPGLKLRLRDVFRTARAVTARARPR